MFQHNWHFNGVITTESNTYTNHHHDLNFDFDIRSESSTATLTNSLKRIGILKAKTPHKLRANASHMETLNCRCWLRSSPVSYINCAASVVRIPQRKGPGAICFDNSTEGCIDYHFLEYLWGSDFCPSVSVTSESNRNETLERKFIFENNPRKIVWPF